MLLANESTRSTGIELIGADQWAQVGGGAYFWDDLQQTNTSTTTDVPVTNLIPLPR